MKRTILLLALVAVFGFTGFSFSADKVVVVPLNTTKISKQQTLSYSIYDIHFNVDGSAIGTWNGCTTNYGNSTGGQVPLTLPIGAKIISVSAWIFDDTSTNVYYISLNRSTIGPEFLTTSTLTTRSGGNNNITITEKDLTPAVTETVDEGESFFLYFNPGGTFTNGFCGAKVTVSFPN